MSDSAGDRIAELARLYLGGRHGELYDKAVSLVGELAVSGCRPAGPAPRVDVKEPVAVRAVFAPSYVDDLRTSLTLVQEKLLATQKELAESQAALKDALQAQVNASKAEKPPMHDVRFGLPLPADCAAHSGPECGWLVTWHEDGARKTAILAAQWDRDYWSRKMATWVPLLRGLPCTWPVGGEPLPSYHVQHRVVIDGLRGALDVARADGEVLARQRDEARARVEEMESRARQLESARVEASDALRIANADIERLRDECRAFEVQSHTTHVEHERTLRELDALRIEFGRSLRAAASLRVECNQLGAAVDRLRASAYEVRETAPTQAELDAHASAGGAWLVAWRGPDAASATLEDSRIPSSWRHPPDWWIALGARRLPCAWPVVRETAEAL